MVNEATVTAPDILASNGIVHVIDRVLLPPDDSMTTTQATPTTDGSTAATDGSTAATGMPPTSEATTATTEATTATTEASSITTVAPPGTENPPTDSASAKLLGLGAIAPLLTAVLL